MSKAEERAQAAYPAWRNGLYDEFNSSSAYCGFIEGYHEAEQDLELTWEDIGAIDNLLWDLSVEHSKNHTSNEVYYKEVLKRFKAQKGEKV